MTSTTGTDDRYTTIGPDAASYERYAITETDEVGVVLYDRECEDAWIASDLVFAVESMR
jgi:hypothetical protein